MSCSAQHEIVSDVYLNAPTVGEVPVCRLQTGVLDQFCPQAVASKSQSRRQKSNNRHIYFVIFCHASKVHYLVSWLFVWLALTRFWINCLSIIESKTESFTGPVLFYNLVL